MARTLFPSDIHLTHNPQVRHIVYRLYVSPPYCLQSMALFYGDDSLYSPITSQSVPCNTKPLWGHTISGSYWTVVLDYNRIRRGFYLALKQAI